MCLDFVIVRPGRDPFPITSGLEAHIVAVHGRGKIRYFLPMSRVIAIRYGFAFPRGWLREDVVKCGAPVSSSSFRHKPKGVLDQLGRVEVAE